MINTDIFKKAEYFLDKNKVIYTGTGRKSIFFNVGDQLVTIETFPDGSKVSCSCTQQSLRKGDVLCSHIISAITYFMDYRRKRKASPIFKE